MPLGHVRDGNKVFAFQVFHQRMVGADSARRTREAFARKLKGTAKSRVVASPSPGFGPLQNGPSDLSQRGALGMPHAQRQEAGAGLDVDVEAWGVHVGR